MDLTKMRILTEANDDLFDIDKEVDAQLKRVTNRLNKKNEVQEPEETDIQEQDEPVEDNSENDDTSSESDNDQSTDYEYNDNLDSSSDTTDIPDDYEPKQAIPELKILTTLSDSEYTLCNVRILNDFKTLRKNVDSTINNLLKRITTKNAKQRQIVNIVHNNLYDMLDDIDNYIIFKNRDIYEENVVAYLTFLKRFQIATNILKTIVEENSKSDKNK